MNTVRRLRMNTARRHLIAKLKRRLAEQEFHALNTGSLPHPVSTRLGACALWDPETDIIYIAKRAFTNASDVVLTIIHELLHTVGYREEAIDETLDRALYVASPSLRAAVAEKALDLFMGWE